MAKYSKKAQDKVEQSIHEFKEGILKSGKDGKGGKVKSKEQAIAIGLSEARKEGDKAPNKSSSKKAVAKKETRKSKEIKETTKIVIAKKITAKKVTKKVAGVKKAGIKKKHTNQLSKMK